MKNWLFKPVTVDGFLWVCIALFTCMQSMLSNDDAYKYVNPTLLFWSKFSVGCLGASAGALKAFRSTTYAQHLSENPTPKDRPQTEPQPKDQIV